MSGGERTEPPRWIPTDYEAYCFLKRHLPAGWVVQAEPSSSYFSEWQFHYRVDRQGVLVSEMAGDFREIEPGSVTGWALSILDGASRR